MFPTEENLRKIEILIEDGYISKKKHPILDLYVLNYTHRCQFDSVWTEETMNCRGLILDKNNNVVARTFKKFFNISQVEESKMENLPATIPTVYEKMDGSLGVLFFDGDKPCIATRGSFNSDQAIWATEWIQKMGYIRRDFISRYTYLFEIIFPQNRIVINYGDRAELVLLAIIDTFNGNEGDFIAEAKRMDFSHAKVYDKNLNELIELVKTLSSDEEGFVVKYTNGLRVKLKGIEYLRLHRLLTGFSTKSIWECLMNEQSFEDNLKDVPDEFFRWCLLKKCELMDNFNQKLSEVYHLYKNVKNLPDRKSQAIEIMKQKDISGAVFALLDGKSPDIIIWKQLKPVYELPFCGDIEN